MMHRNLSLNDYDFVLFHLYISNKQYHDYYLNIQMEKRQGKHKDRIMIFDNSAYEFFVKGQKLDLGKFREAILELCPDYYILPDVLQDKDKTLEGVGKFLTNYASPHWYSKPLAVAQGKTSEELVECFQQYMEMNIAYVGVPFHLEFYKDMHIQDDILAEFGIEYADTDFQYSEDYKYATGRVQWVRNHEHLLKMFEKVHMLGSHCPLEKVFYKDYFSMDTAYPVKLGYDHRVLGTEDSKPLSIIDDFLEDDLSPVQERYIEENINIFRKY